MSKTHFFSQDFLSYVETLKETEKLEKHFMQTYIVILQILSVLAKKNVGTAYEKALKDFADFMVNCGINEENSIDHDQAEKCITIFLSCGLISETIIECNDRKNSKFMDGNEADVESDGEGNIFPPPTFVRYEMYYLKVFDFIFQITKPIKYRMNCFVNSELNKAYILCRGCYKLTLAKKSKRFYVTD